MAESSNPNPQSQPPGPVPGLGEAILSYTRELYPTLDFSTPSEIGLFFQPDTDSISIIHGQESIHVLLKKVMINSLPVVEIKEPGSVCVICLSELPVNGTATVKELPCGHRFHSECIDRWLGRHLTCPLCRDPVQKNDGLKTSGWKFHVFYMARSNGSNLGLRAFSFSDVNVDGGEDGGGAEVEEDGHGVEGC